MMVHLYRIGRDDDDAAPVDGGMCLHEGSIIMFSFRMKNNTGKWPFPFISE